MIWLLTYYPRRPIILVYIFPNFLLFLLNFYIIWMHGSYVNTQYAVSPYSKALIGPRNLRPIKLHYVSSISHLKSCYVMTHQTFETIDFFVIWIFINARRTDTFSNITKARENITYTRSGSVLYSTKLNICMNQII